MKAAAARFTLGRSLPCCLARCGRAFGLCALGARLCGARLLDALALGALMLGCGRAESATEPSDASIARQTEALGVLRTPAPEALASPNTASWDDAPLAKLRDGPELGCEARRLQLEGARGQETWLRVRCLETQDYGVPYELQLESGRDPRQLVRRVGAGGLERSTRGGRSSAAELPPNEARGLVELVTPFEPGARIEAGISWLGAYRSLELRWPAHTPLPEWVGALTQRVPPKALETCRGLQHDLEARLGRLQLDPADRRGLPPGVNRCVAGNAGAWVVSAEDVAVLPCGDARCLSVQFAISLVDAAGERSPAVGPRLRFLPGTLTLEQGALDFDGDRQEDFFTIFESKGFESKGFESSALESSALEGKARSGDPSLSRLWTRRDHVEILPDQPDWFFHGVARTDTGLPSLLGYGPFVAALPATCGLPQCPTQLTGPELLAHNLGHSFSFVDDVARHQLDQSCGELGPLELSGGAGGAGAQSAEPAEIAPLARAVACRRLFGAAPEALLAELRTLRPRLCAEPSGACPVLDVLLDWARQPLPAALVGLEASSHGSLSDVSPSDVSPSNGSPAPPPSRLGKRAASHKRPARRRHVHRRP